MGVCAYVAPLFKTGIGVLSHKVKKSLRYSSSVFFFSAQGETFYPFDIETGGSTNEHLREFIVALASLSSPSPPELALFLGYAR